MTRAAFGSIGAAIAVAIGVATGAVLIASGTLVHVDQVGSRPVPAPAIRARVDGFEALQEWFELVRAHEIGEFDRSAKEMASTTTVWLFNVRTDLRLVRALIEGAVASRTKRVMSPSNGKILTLQKLAPLMGLTADELDLPAELTFLGDPENPARRIISRIMIRAAMLHTRVAMEPAVDMPPGPPVPGFPGSRVVPPLLHSAVRIQDGQQTLIADLSHHWTIAREALDIVGPPPAASAAVRAWYDATLTYLQNKRLYNALLPQLEHARMLFPNDGTVFLFSGAVSENLALPKVQVAVLDASSSVGKPADLLRQAERYYRRALELDPNLPMTTLRLGRVLTLTNRNDEAAQLLQTAETAVSTPEAKYLAAMFLGRAEEGRARDEPARAAYRRAADLFAGAQSPRIALASLAGRRGEQDDALSHLRVLATVNPLDVFGDPWWRYDVIHVGDIDALFDRLDLAVAKAMR